MSIAATMPAGVTGTRAGASRSTRAGAVPATEANATPVAASITATWSPVRNPQDGSMPQAGCVPRSSETAPAGAPVASAACGASHGTVTTVNLSGQADVSGSALQ